MHREDTRQRTSVRKAGKTMLYEVDNVRSTVARTRREGRHGSESHLAWHMLGTSRRQEQRKTRKEKRSIKNVLSICILQHFLDVGYCTERLLSGRVVMSRPCKSLMQQDRKQNISYQANSNNETTKNRSKNTPQQAQQQEWARF